MLPLAFRIPQRYGPELRRHGRQHPYFAYQKDIKFTGTGRFLHPHYFTSMNNIMCEHFLFGRNNIIISSRWRFDDESPDSDTGNVNRLARLRDKSERQMRD